MKKLLSISFLLVPAILALFVLPTSKTPIVHAATASHIVISEVQVAGGTVDDEFIELYNPTATNIDLTGWRLTRKTGATESNLVASMSGTISSHGFFLIAKPTTYDGAITADLVYSAGSNALATNNTVLLYSDAGITLVDKVGLGTATDFETTAAANPAANGSAERKATSTSNETSMTSGVDTTNGNGEDTDNNSADFISRTTSDPQNASSATETPVGVTLTVSPTGSISPTLTPTQGVSPTISPTGSVAPTATVSVTTTSNPSPTNSPTNTPSATPSPTLSATNTPTSTPSVIPTNTPTSTPTVSSTITATPSLSATPTVAITVTPTPSPTPTGGQVLGTFPFPGGQTVVCTLEYRRVGAPFLSFFIPFVHCTHIHK